MQLLQMKLSKRASLQAMQLARLLGMASTREPISQMKMGLRFVSNSID